MSNRMEPDQDGHYVGPDLVPNCFQRSEADYKSHPCEETYGLTGYETLHYNIVQRTSMDFIISAEKPKQNYKLQSLEQL